MNTFEELEVWKSARALRNKVSELVKTFPKQEQYRLTDQIIRSSRSISANIAEGFGRFHYRENIQFCRQARGSLFETLDHLICAHDLDYIDKTTLNNLKDEIMQNLKLLNGYIVYLKRAVNQ
jgi:four helix bundle protein